MFQISPKEAVMDADLSQLKRMLGQAINDALSESDRIAEAIGNLRDEGYDVFLILKANIGFTRINEAQGTKDPQTPEPSPNRGSPKFTGQDESFAKELKIRLDDPEAPLNPPKEKK